ncbi:hypothetical protein L2E82_40236 [Cichorium intybus]|uniref:Uncharacterized protein n=1 Tax=Cichorium intybus TaxID=13427 RepID=A0ACB9AL67_CICIN|nr:hypothetical protein L2E82_40236 [Cichorium intybus]
MDSRPEANSSGDKNSVSEEMEPVQMDSDCMVFRERHTCPILYSAAAGFLSPPNLRPLPSHNHQFSISSFEYLVNSVIRLYFLVDI